MFKVVACKKEPDVWGNDNMWACWTSWNEATESLNYGHYNLSKERSYEIFMENADRRKVYKGEQDAGIVKKIKNELL